MTIEAEVYQLMHGVADQLARAYHARCWWANMRDLAQEAWVAQLEAFRAPTRRQELELRPYLYRVAAVALRNWTLRNSTVMSEKRRQLHRLKGVKQVSIFDVPIDEMPRCDSNTAEGLHDARNGAALATHLRRALRQGAGGGSARGGEAAVEVLLNGVRPARLAKERQVPAVEIHRATTSARRRVRTDPEIARLWQER